MKYFYLLAFCFIASIASNAQALKFDTLCTINGTPIFGHINNISADYIYITTLSGNDTKVPRDLIVKCKPEQLDSLRNGLSLSPTAIIYNQDAPKFRYGSRRNEYLINAGSFLAVSIVGTITGSVLSSVGAVTGKPGLAYAGVGIGGVSLLLNIGTAVNLIKAGKRYEFNYAK